MKAYLKAKSEGDKNIYWIDAAFARGFEAEEGTVDGGHATDMSYVNTARSMAPLLRKLIYKD
jgi:lysophospholipase L1-like esterase